MEPLQWFVVIFLIALPIVVNSQNEALEKKKKMELSVDGFIGFTSIVTGPNLTAYQSVNTYKYDNTATLGMGGDIGYPLSMTNMKPIWSAEDIDLVPKPECLIAFSRVLFDQEGIVAFNSSPTEEREEHVTVKQQPFIKKRCYNFCLVLPENWMSLKALAAAGTILNSG